MNAVRHKPRRRNTLQARKPGTKVVLSDVQHPRGRGRSGIDATAAGRYTDNHFADASGRTIDEIMHGSRQVLVSRCRYEARNNCYAKGIIRSLANHIVGTTPTLQMQTGSRVFNTELENRFRDWMPMAHSAERLSFGQLLNLDVGELAQTGDALNSIVNDSTVPLDEVSLRLRDIRPERLASPYVDYNQNMVDGITIDPDTGRALSYNILKTMPGNLFSTLTYESSTVSAGNMIHLYLYEESEQYRGVPLLQPALPLLADLRRYTKAVVAAAEQQANISGVLKSVLPDVQAAQLAAMDNVEILRNALLTLPEGWDIEAFKPGQPTSTYAAFKAEIIAEVGRAVLMPFIVASGNAQGYNYSSGRLDWQDFWKAIGIFQHWLGVQKCDRVLAMFLDEASRIPGYFKHYTGHLRKLSFSKLKHRWNWPGQEHVDPVKEATADDLRLQNGTTTLAEIYGRKGKDWEREVTQRFNELAFIRELKEALSLTDEMIGNALNTVIVDEVKKEAMNDE